MGTMQNTHFMTVIADYLLATCLARAPQSGGVSSASPGTTAPPWPHTCKPRRLSTPGQPAEFASRQSDTPRPLNVGPRGTPSEAGLDTPLLLGCSVRSRSGS